jgi:hypothetical protein
MEEAMVGMAGRWEGVVAAAVGEDFVGVMR